VKFVHANSMVKIVVTHKVNHSHPEEEHIVRRVLKVIFVEKKPLGNNL
jgi:hypothetical protein